MNKNLIAFKYIHETILPKLNKLNIKLNLEFDKDYVTTGDSEFGCSGFYDNTEGVLETAIGSKNIDDWFSTLLHEMSHVEQCEEQCKEWINSQEGDKNSDYLLDDFLEGKEIDNIQEKIKSCMLLELDCEKRTEKKLDLFPTIFNKEEYIQKSNAYVAFYKQMYIRKQWYNPKKAPYLMKNIWTNMPTTFIDDKAYFDNYEFNNIDWNLVF